jgi:hypothetical protein
VQKPSDHWQGRDCHVQKPSDHWQGRTCQVQERSGHWQGRDCHAQEPSDHWQRRDCPEILLRRDLALHRPPLLRGQIRYDASSNR